MAIENNKYRQADSTRPISSFHRLSVAQRISMIAELAGLDPDELDAVSLEHGLGIDQADRMIENAIGVLGIPLGLCSNLRVDGRDRIVPMATEEPSVIAAA